MPSKSKVLDEFPKFFPSRDARVLQQCSATEFTCQRITHPHRLLSLVLRARAGANPFSILQHLIWYVGHKSLRI
jgi:hypothetical protein